MAYFWSMDSVGDSLLGYLKLGQCDLIHGPTFRIAMYSNKRMIGVRFEEY